MPREHYSGAEPAIRRELPVGPGCGWQSSAVERAASLFSGEGAAPLFFGERAAPLFFGERAAPLFFGERAAPPSSPTHPQGDLGLNICEAHAFNTKDKFVLDVFVINGWTGGVSGKGNRAGIRADGTRGSGARQRVFVINGWMGG